jgi:hypothetical protein
MRASLSALMVLLGAASLGHTGPVDLSKIDRTIGKEPAYRTRSPKYCLLLFGPEAKKRVWLVHDGDRLYVDRNGNGDLTEEREEAKGAEQRRNLTSPIKGERVEARIWRFYIGAVHEGKARHDALVVEIQHFEYTPKEGKPRIVDHTAVTLELEGKWQQSASGNFSFARRPQDAPVIHLNGPLTLVPRYENQVLKRGGNGDRLRIGIGTPGLGNGPFAFLTTDAAPADIHPVAEVEFPPASADARPIRARVVLARRC